MTSSRSRIILDLVDNKDNGSSPNEEHDQANTVSNEPEQTSEIISAKSIDVQMLHDVRNKPENCQYLNALEYFKDTEDNDSPPLKLGDQILRDVEKEPENAKDRIRTSINYRISPINPEESDADLSDGDPIFNVQEDKRVNNLLFPPNHRTSSSSNSSSSTLSSSSSDFYYKSKLNSYNFTIASLNKKVEGKIQDSYNNVQCYFWSETDAKRGANEIGSCLLNYFEKLCCESRATIEEGIDLILYSDNCGGQNKNKFIVTVYLYAVTHLNIKSITHKYLIKSHRQNEADNIHSLIEKEIIFSTSIHLNKKKFTKIRLQICSL